jgi:hypothetical protein
MVTVRFTMLTSRVLPSRTKRSPRRRPVSAGPSTSLMVVVPSASSCATGTKPLPESTAKISSPRAMPASAAGLFSNTSRIIGRFTGSVRVRSPKPTNCPSPSSEFSAAGVVR